MSTKLLKQLTYDASVEDVVAMFDDRAFREAVLERQQVLRGSVAIDGDVARIDQVRSAANIPSFARSLVGEEIVTVQTETWTSPTDARVEIVVPGKPWGAVGTMSFTGSGAMTTERVELAVSVKIPFVGAKAEGLIAAIIRDALDREHEVGVEWLARR